MGNLEMEMELEMEEQMEQEQVQKTNGVFLFIYFLPPPCPFTRQVFRIEGITCDKCVRLITEVDISKS